MHLPHLNSFEKQPLVFLTACTDGRKPVLAEVKAFAVLTEIWTKSAAIDGWFVGHFMLMPDHVHLFAMPTLEAKPLAAWIKSWKSISARRLGPPLWQPDYFDHFIRSLRSYREKWDYVQQNPMRRELCQRSVDWPYQGTIHDLQFK